MDRFGWFGSACCAVALLVPAAQALAIDAAAARRAVAIWRADQPGDDIQYDFRGSHVLVADLDHHGADEIVYLATATCVQANFDCDNEFTVMSVLATDDRRIHSGPLDKRAMRDFWRRARATGYADDVGIHMPGAVEDVTIANGRIRVQFSTAVDSPVCKRTLRDADAQTAREHHAPRLDDTCGGLPGVRGASSTTRVQRIGATDIALRKHVVAGQAAATSIASIADARYLIANNPHTPTA